MIDIMFENVSAFAQRNHCFANYLKIAVENVVNKPIKFRLFLVALYYVVSIHKSVNYAEYIN